MASYTEHYGLHQWEPNDDFLRTDFNTDLEKIDTALGDVPKIAVGSYVGDNSSIDREIVLGFRPSMVYICTLSYNFYSGGDIYGGLITEQFPLCRNHISGPVLAEASEQGFVLHPNTGEQINSKDTTYLYFAIKG